MIWKLLSFTMIQLWRSATTNQSSEYDINTVLKLRMVKNKAAPERAELKLGLQVENEPKFLSQRNLY